MKLLKILGIVATAMLILGASAADPPDQTTLSSGIEDGCFLQKKVAEYQGAKACKKCHFAQHLSWKKTKMAKTYDILKPGEAPENPMC